MGRRRSRRSWVLCRLLREGVPPRHPRESGDPGKNSAPTACQRCTVDSRLRGNDGRRGHGGECESILSTQRPLRGPRPEPFDSPVPKYSPCFPRFVTASPRSLRRCGRRRGERSKAHDRVVHTAVVMDRARPIVDAHEARVLCYAALGFQPPRRFAGGPSQDERHGLASVPLEGAWVPRQLENLRAQAQRRRSGIRRAG
jgi:hypothetical protein